MTTQPRDPRARTASAVISERFPLLSEQAGLVSNIRDDLVLTDTEFGKKYKRGKTARLEFLENMENRLQLAPLRAKLAHMEQLTTKLENLIEIGNQGFGSTFATPRNLEQARVVLEMTFLRRGVEGPEFGIDTSSMEERLGSIASDEVARDIIRDLILNIRGDYSVSDIADKHGLGKQAIYDRQGRLVNKLDELIEQPDFQLLVAYLRNNTCVLRGSKLVSSTAHPLIAILLLERAKFPSIHDVVALGLWAVARAETGDKKTFQFTSRGENAADELIIDTKAR